MKLLEAKIVKEKKGKDLEELAVRIKKYQAEEKRLIKHISDLEEKEEKERTRIENDLTLVRNEAELEIQKSVLFQEVRHLEGRKTEALKPINEIKKEADKNFEEAKQTVADANRRALAVKEATTRLTERLEDVSDKEAEAHSKIVELNRREASIEAAEGELKRATESLGTKWVEYHDEVYKKNEELVRREKEILDNQKVNAIYKESLDAITREQEKLKIGIKDGYASLERAKQEILKQNGSS